MGMTIGIKYCGGCNPGYDRVALVRQLQKVLPEGIRVCIPADGRQDLLVAVQGCPTACADLSPFEHMPILHVCGPTESVRLAGAIQRVLSEPKRIQKEHRNTMKYLNLTVSDGVGTVLIDRPEKKNALSPEVLEEIATLFTRITHQEDIRVVILTGGEELFSAGFDLDFIRTLEKASNEEFTALFHRAYRAILFCSQPVIAAVGGPAIAGGFDLTLMCDIRYASQRARFGQREVVLALTPLIDPLWRIIGLGRAKEVALTGRIYDALEAEKMGYVSQVFPDGELLASVTTIARSMAAYDRSCLQETKALSHKVLNLDMDGAMKTQEWLFRSFIGSAENHARIDTLMDQLKQRKKR